MFLINSRLGLFSAAVVSPQRRPLSRSYRTNLPSSLTAANSSALVYSTQLPVSVCGTGQCVLKRLADFLGSMVTSILLHPKDSHTIRFDSYGGFAYHNQHLHPLTYYSNSRQDCHFSVSTSLNTPSKGILTLSSIEISIRITLRSRLTLLRRTVRRKP